MKISLDFDGVLFPKEQYTNRGQCYGPPMPGAVAFVHEALVAGHEVFILTSRMADLMPHTAHAVEREIKTWLLEHFGPEAAHRIAVTATKNPADIYIDDRGYRFHGEWPIIQTISSGFHGTVEEFDAHVAAGGAA